MDKETESAAAISYEANYRNIKHARLEFKTGSLRLILPKGYSNEKDLLAKYGRWILNKNLMIQRAFDESRFKQLDEERTAQELKIIVGGSIAQYQKDLKVTIKAVTFRKMRTKWASYSQNHTITVNTLLKYLPKDLIEYVTYHEMVHAKQGRKHDINFWALISKKYQNHQEKETDLLVYWFLVQEKLLGKKN